MSPQQNHAAVVQKKLTLLLFQRSFAHRGNNGPLYKYIMIDWSNDLLLPESVTDMNIEHYYMIVCVHRNR